MSQISRAWENFASLPSVPTEVEPSTSSMLRLWVFRLQGRRYALPVESVEGSRSLTGVEFMRGRVRWGQLELRLVDAKQRLNMAGELGSICIVVRPLDGAPKFGLVVDGIEPELLSVDRRLLQPMPAHVSAFSPVWAVLSSRVAASAASVFILRDSI